MYGRVMWLMNNINILRPFCDILHYHKQHITLTAWLEVLGRFVELLYFFGTVLVVAGSLSLLTGPQTLLDHLHNLLVHFAEGRGQQHRMTLFNSISRHPERYKKPEFQRLIYPVAFKCLSDTVHNKDNILSEVCCVKTLQLNFWHKWMLSLMVMNQSATNESYGFCSLHLFY